MLNTEEILIYVVLKRLGGRMKVRGCLVLLIEDTSYFGKVVIRELLVLVCLLLSVGLTVLSRWSELMSGSCMCSWSLHIRLLILSPLMFHKWV